MTIAQAKQELIRRYQYLNKNAIYFLAPHVKEVAWDKDNDQTSIIYLALPQELISLTESFLLSETMLEESKLYLFLEECKANPIYLKKAETGYLLAQKQNDTNDILKISLDFGTILTMAQMHLQDGNISDCFCRLNVLEEYEKLFQYHGQPRARKKLVKEL